MIYVVGAFCAAAAAYQLLALAACIRQMLRRQKPPSEFPPISILKPVRGTDVAFSEAVRSHAAQDYPEFEVLFGVGDAADPAIAVIERVAREFPQVSIRVVYCRSVAANRKVGVLTELGRQARYPVVVVNDGDIRVPRGYLRDIVAPLVDDGAGLVTCLYRARAEQFPARFEALGIATDFAPSALVAPLVGVNEFGMGSTLALRADTLRSIGGFEAVADFIADDYQIGARVSRLGKRVVLSPVVVETHLHGDTWDDVWRHQLRWARTIRVSRTGGYLGIPVSNATVSAVLAAACGAWWSAGALLALRYVVAVVAAGGVLRDRGSMALVWLTPVRDLFGLAIWAAGLVGNRVEWGGRVLQLDGEGRIKKE